MRKPDFHGIARDMDEENISGWIEDHQDEIIEYAEDGFRDRYGSYQEDEGIECAVHDAIDRILDDMYMPDYESDDSDIICAVEDILF